MGAGINGLVAAHYLRRAGHTVTVLDRAARPGGACISATATVNGLAQSYSLGASVLGLMPDFIFRETGLAERLETYVPTSPKRVYFPTASASAWVYRDPGKLDREFKERWGETGDAAGFRADESRVVEFLQQGYRDATPPNVDAARSALGNELTRLWISGSAADLLGHYFTAERTKIYLAMTVTESGPVSLAEPSSAFTLPLMDSGSVFGGYYGFVRPGLWRLTEELAAINREIGIEFLFDAMVEQVDPGRGVVRFHRHGADQRRSFDHLVFATDPSAAARLVGDEETVRRIAKQRVLGSSGKITMFFRRPVRWREGTQADHDAAFRFVFSTETLDDFEHATVRVRAGDVDYVPGYIQVYCEGAAMRRLGAAEPFDRLTLFFKNLGLGRKGDELDEVKERVTAQVLAHIANPEDCVWSRLLTPKDLQELFLFPGGNLDHTELTTGQQFADRQVASDPGEEFYQFGAWSNLSYCGAGSYPCGSIAGTPGYMAATQLARRHAR